MINLKKKMDLKELEGHFNYIHKMVTNEINVYDKDIKLCVLGLIFFKRIYDIDHKYTNLDWTKIRNRAAHASDRYEYFLEEDLSLEFDKIGRLYYRLSGFSNQVKINYPNNILSLIPIILYLDSIDLSLDSINTSIMGQAYENLIRNFYGKKNDIFITKSNIVKIASSIINIQPYETLYDPCIGIGSFYTEIIRNNQNDYLQDSLPRYFYGQELDRNIFYIAVMNLIMNGVEDINIDSNDSILNPIYNKINERTKFNKIISHIPSGKLSNRTYHENMYFQRMSSYIMPTRSLEYVFIQHIIERLEEDGKAVIVLPTQILYSGGQDKKIRKIIVEEDLIESIITLPVDNTRIELAIVVLNKNKPIDRKYKIIFIHTNKQNHQPDLLEVKQIISIYEEYVELKDYSNIVNLDEIRNKEYDLNHKRYSTIFVENEILLAEGKAKKIIDVVDVFTQRSMCAKEFSGYNKSYIQNKNLNKDITEQYINYDSISIKQLDRVGIKDFDTAILVTLMGSELKPTIIKYEELDTEELILGVEIIALIPDKRYIDIEYLYYQLYSPRVIQQLELLRVGPQSKILKSIFLDIVISVPSLEVQKEYVKEQKIFLIEMEKIKYMEKTKALALEDSISDAEETVISILAHNTLPYITNMQFDINILKRFLQDSDLDKTICDPYRMVEEEDEFGEVIFIKEMNPTPEKVLDVLSRIENILNTFENIISETKKTVQLNLNKNDFELTNLKVIFQEIKEEKFKESIAKYEINIECEDIFIMLHKPSIKELFIQLIRNAEMHAFDSSSKKNKINFKIIEKSDQVIITYSNNGKKFAITKNEYINLGKKSQGSKGHGLGGAYINKVIKAHGGYFNINKVNTGMKMEIVLKRGE